MSDKKEEEKKIKSYDRIEGSHKNGGFLFDDPEMMKKHRSAAWDMIKKMGKSLIASKEEKAIVNVSLPVYVFEPRSYLERMCDHWCYLPDMLTKAALTKDPVERFRWVVTELVAGLHNTLIQLKPFNPILGETFEAEYEDGTQIFMEQSSHHPPVSNFEVIGPKNIFHVYGYGEWSASFSGNTVKGHHIGPITASFSDGTSITYSRPRMDLSGLIFGDRVIEYVGTVKFRDLKNGLAMDLVFGPPAPSGFFGWFGQGKPPSDYLMGSIVKATGKDGEPQKGDEVMSTIGGSWLGCVEWDEKVYWDFKKSDKKYKLIAMDNLLPSDSRFRQDLLFLKKEDVDTSQIWKDKLEIKQRQEKELRKKTTEVKTKESKKEKKKNKSKDKEDK